MMRMKRLVVIVAVCGAMWLGADAARACDVPVFRYALERWRPDPYPMVIFHRGKLSDEHQKIAMHIEKVAEGDDLNVVADNVDLAGEPDPAAKAYWEKLKDKSLPRLVVLRPRGAAGDGPLWSSEISMAAVNVILDSPKRKELARRLLTESAVWVFLEGGNKAADDAVALKLSAELARLPEVIEVSKPPGQEDAESVTYDYRGQQFKWSTKLVFSMLRVSRTDPAEKAFVQMLLSTEPGLTDKEFDGQPMVFPVFGRGRALEPMIGKGIARDNLETAAGFLAGPCGCEIKDQNPGVDMLIRADWDKALGNPTVVTIELPPLVGVVQATQPVATAPAGTADAGPADEPSEAGPAAGLPVWTGALVAGLALVVAVGILSWILMARSKQGSA